MEDVSDSTQFAINHKGNLLSIDTIYGAVNLKSTSFIYYMCGGGRRMLNKRDFIFLVKTNPVPSLILVIGLRKGLWGRLFCD